MSDLIIAVFSTQNAAFVAGEMLASLQQEAGTEPEDIVVVTQDGTGRLSVHHSTDLATGAAHGGGRWGMLIGMMFLDARKPKPGGTGLAAQFRNAGVDPKLLEDISAALAKNCAAVGMRVRKLGADRVAARLKTLKGAPRLFTARLGPEAEENLYNMQAQIPQTALARISDSSDF
jgi:uncharacterized membrane protein